MMEKGQVVGNRIVRVLFLWLWRFSVVAVISGLLIIRAESAEEIKEAGTRLGILSLSEKTVAPDFTLENPAGTPVSLQDFRGKVVFLNFWATWCIPCRTEMPAMEKLYQEFREKGLVVVAVNFQDEPEAVQDFRQELHLTFPMILDREGKVATAYGVRGLPATYILDRDGRMIGQAIGAREWDSTDAMAYFRQLLIQ